MKFNTHDRAVNVISQPPILSLTENKYLLLTHLNRYDHATRAVLDLTRSLSVNIFGIFVNVLIFLKSESFVISFSVEIKRKTFTNSDRKCVKTIKPVDPLWQSEIDIRKLTLYRKEVEQILILTAFIVVSLKFSYIIPLTTIRNSIFFADVGML